MVRNIARVVHQSFIWTVRRLPIVSRLADCTIKDHLQALKELSFAFAFSTVTFWLGAIIMMPQKLFSEKGYWELLLSTFANGELLIFSVSFIGPIFLATLVDRPAGKTQFPGREWHMAFLIIIALISAALFSTLKSQQIAQGGLQNLDMEFLRTSSYLLALLAVLLRYLTFVYQKNMNTLDEYGPKDAMRFADSYKVHAEDKGE